MYRVIRNFTLGDTAYNIGDLVAESDNQAIQDDPFFQRFVVRIAPASFPHP